MNNIKICKKCNLEKHIPDEIYNTSHICYKCKDEIETKKQENKKNNIWIHVCKDCGNDFQTNVSNILICDECRKHRDQEKHKKTSLHICTRCKNEFIKDYSSRTFICNECKKQIENDKEYHTTCVKCDQSFSRESNFTHKKFICDECAEAINAEEYFDKTYRYCGECKEYKLIGKETSYKAFYCDECDKKRRRARVVAKKKTSWTRVCPDCGEKVVTTKPRATVVYCEKCRERKRQLKRDKILREMNREKQDYCQICKKKTVNDERKDRNIVCPECRHLMKEYKERHRESDKYFKTCNKCNKKFEVFKDHFWEPLQCYECGHQKQPEDNRHKFGYQGKCSDGHKYQSLNEMDFDEWLVARGIEHIAHPRLKPTYRCSDYYLPKYDRYVEIDGLDRQDDVDWCGKLSVYEKLSIKPLIITPVSKHFIENRDVCFGELDLKVLPSLA